MAKIHYDEGPTTACGVTTSWQRRFAAKEQLDVAKTKDKAAVTCLNCRRNWAFTHD